MAVDVAQSETTGSWAMKLCVCGYLGHPTRPCTCTPEEVRRYRSRLSGPLADRIDLHITLSPVPLAHLGDTAQAEGSAVIRQRVECARERQRERHDASAHVACNARMSGRAAVSMLGTDARRLLKSAGETLDLSARAYHRVAKVARTIADLAGEAHVESDHVAEALRYRPIQAPRA